MKITKEAIVVGYKTLTRLLSKNSPTILTAIGTGLMVAGVVVTIVNAPKAKDEIDILEEDEEISHKEYVKDKTRIIVRYYWPTAAMTFGGAGLIFWGHKISLGRTAAALAAYQMSKDDLKKLEDKITEVDGEKHLNKLKEDITKDTVNKSAPVNYSTVINTGHGNLLCYDPIAHDYYWSDLDFIDKMVEKANKEMATTRWNMRRPTMSYDRWRDYIDLPALDGTVDDKEVAPAIGKDLGWMNRPIELKKTCVVLPDNTVCHVIGFTKNGMPKWFQDIDDYDGEDINRKYSSNIDDDETDMKWRGR